MNKKSAEKKQENPAENNTKDKGKKKKISKDKKAPSDLDQANQKILELTDSLQRLQAEFENYKKQVDKKSLENLQFASANIIMKILPIIDTFEIAIKNSEDPKKFKQGIELIYAQIMSALKNEGLETINSQGKIFNPYLHEAMMAVESDKEKDTVLEVLQKGYTLKGRVLRHSKVKISK